MTLALKQKQKQTPGGQGRPLGRVGPAQSACPVTAPNILLHTAYADPRRYDPIGWHVPGTLRVCRDHWYRTVTSHGPVLVGLAATINCRSLSRSGRDVLQFASDLAVVDERF